MTRKPEAAFKLQSLFRCQKKAALKKMKMGFSLPHLQIPGQN